MAEVVEADGPDLAGGPQLHAALRAPPQLRVGRPLRVAATLPSALVHVECDDPGAVQGTPQHSLKDP